ncbi:ABC transporter ATP-binding protein, partial [Klebsiella pneumoniae]
IHDTLRSVTRSRTTILIAHRRSTLSLADRIAVLDEGRVVDVGAFEELWQRCDLFRDLVRGPGDDAEEIHRDGDLAPDATGVTPRLWPRTDEDDLTRSAASTATLHHRTAVGGPGSRAALDLPPTPELLERVRKLPEATGEPRLDGVDPTAPDPNFRLRGLLRPVRALLAAVVALVAVDALAV